MASSTRPARIRSSMPESSADCQSGSSLERPAARSSSRASDSTSNSVAYSGPSSSRQSPPQPRGQGRAAPAGADGDHEIALAHDRHEGERAVRGVVGGVHPDPPGLAGLEHRAVDRGVAGGGGGEPGVVEVGGRELPLGRAASRPASAQARTSSPTSGATTCTSAPAASRASILRAAMRPAPTTTQRRPATTRLTGYPVMAGRPTGGSSLIAPQRRRPRRCATRSRASAPSPAAAGRRTGSAARSRGRPCAATRRSGAVTTVGREVQDRRDAGVDQAVGDLLRRVRGRGDDADGDAAARGRSSGRSSSDSMVRSPTRLADLLGIGVDHRHDAVAPGAEAPVVGQRLARGCRRPRWRRASRG